MSASLDGTIYLLHFDRPYQHAAHYIGWADDLDARLARHRSGTGARLLAVLREHGIGWTLARTWRGTRSRERQLKTQGGAAALCPVCRAAGARSASGRICHPAAQQEVVA